MFSEVVKLSPQIDRSAMNRMFQTLNQRFASVSSKFAHGLKQALRFSPAAIGGAIGAVLIQKLLNPLQKAEEIIDRILHKGDDAVNQAQELGTTPGAILRLNALGQTRGVDPETMNMLVSRFQAALAKEQEIVKAPAVIQSKVNAEQDPVQKGFLQQQLFEAQKAAANPGSLRNFIGIKDTAEAFFKFVQSLRTLEPSRRTTAETEVFGEKIRGKASEFFNSTNAADEAILKKFPSVEVLNAAADRANNLSDERDRLTALREIKDFVRKAAEVNIDQVNALNTGAQIELNKEDIALKNFNSLKAAKNQVDLLSEKFEELATTISTKVIPLLTKSLEGLNAIADGTIAKGIGSLFPTFPSIFPAQPPAGTPVTDQQLNALTPGFSNGNNDQQALINLTNTIETIWGEFKSSRFYKYFGGSK